MIDHRQRSLKLLARLDQDVAEAESLVSEFPLDDTKHQEAVDALTELRAARERLERLLGSEAQGGE